MEIKQIKTKEEAQMAVDYYHRDDVVEFEFAPGEMEVIKKNIFACLEEESRAYWIALEGDEIVGICGIYENEMKSGGYYLDYFSTRADYRGKGLGRKLYDICENFAKERKGRYIIIETGDGDATKTARGVYESFGYKQVGHIPGYYTEHEGKFEYYKKL